MLIGEYDVTIDEKGRVMIPAKLRSQMAGNDLIVARGPKPELNLMLFLPEEWKALNDKLYDPEKTSLFNPRDRQRRRQTVGEEVKIDNAGRILIPQKLKAYAGLKKEVCVLGQIDYLELWDAEKYALHMQESEERGVYEEDQKELKE